LQEAVASVHPQASAKDINIDLYGVDERVLAWGDRGRLNQVLGILLNNAVKFTGRGGLITLGLQKEANDTLVMTVRDTGIGIDPAYHDKVFHKFFQVDSSKTRQYEGTGIGLSIAKNIVEAHGGDIQLQSAPGEGSAFTIRLPGAQFHSALEEGVPADLPTQTALAISGNPAFVDAVSGVIQSCGCTIHPAGHGHEAVRATHSERPDFILVNRTSQEGGESTVGLLRNDPVCNSLPIIICSEEGPEQLGALGTVWEGLSFIHKPFTAAELIDGIRGAMPAGGEAAAPAAADTRRQEVHPRVLVVDNDPGLLEWVETALRLRHVPCYCATGPENAAKLLHREQADVIFVNVDVPNSDPEEQVAPLRSAGKGSATPIYVMTGLPGRRTLPAGAAGVVTKPFSIEELCALIPKASPRHAAASGRQPRSAVQRQG